MEKYNTSKYLQGLLEQKQKWLQEGSFNTETAMNFLWNASVVCLEEPIKLRRTQQSLKQLVCCVAVLSCVVGLPALYSQSREY